MKRTLIVLALGLLSVGCLTPEQKLRDSVVGEYEIKKDGDTLKLVLLENGIYEWYVEEYKWSIVDGHIHLIDEDGDIAVFSINKDGVLTGIASIDKDGKRTDIPKEHQYTYKKIK